MMLFVRTYLSLALAALVALASVSHALARHQAHGATTMVICTGYGLVRITLDVDGKPVEHSLPCPDCTLTQTALLTNPARLACPAERGEMLLGVPQTRKTPCAAQLWPQSRAPPSLA